MSAVTFKSLADKAVAEMKGEIDSLNVTWSDIFDGPRYIMRVKASWWALGKSDAEIMAKARELQREESGGGR